MRERRPERHEQDGLPVYLELRVRRYAPGIGASVDVPGLERRDLGHVEYITDVQPVPGHLEATEPVDRKVAERVRGGGRWPKQRGRDDDEDREAFHRSSRPATGAQRTENSGFRRSARASHVHLACS